MLQGDLRGGGGAAGVLGSWGGRRGVCIHVLMWEHKLSQKLRNIH